MADYSSSVLAVYPVAWPGLVRKLDISSAGSDGQTRGRLYGRACLAVILRYAIKFLRYLSQSPAYRLSICDASVTPVAETVSRVK